MESLQALILREVAQYAPANDKAAIHAFLPDSYVDIYNCPELSVEGVDHVVMRRDSLRKLSNDAKAVIAIILDSPIDVLNANASLSLTRLCNKLKHEFGWTWSRIYRTRNELATYAKELG